jgi:hypothetical protein
MPRLLFKDLAKSEVEPHVDPVELVTLDGWTSAAQASP